MRRGRLDAGHGELLAGRYATDGAGIALGYADGTVAVTDAALGAPRTLLSVPGHRVESVAFAADGRVAAGLDDGTVRVLTADGSKDAVKLAGHDGAVLGVDLDPDGARVVSAGADGSVRLWDTGSATAQMLLDGKQPENDVHFSPDGSRILAVGNDRRIRFWDARSGAAEPPMSGDGRQLVAAAFSPDGRRFAAGGRDGVTRVWSVDGGPPVAELRGQRARVYDVGFAPAGDHVVSAGDDGAVRIWDAGRTRSWTLPSLTYDLDFNRDGRSLASSNADGTMRVWDPATGALRTSLDGPSGFTYGTFSPIDDRIVIATGARARIWPVAASTAEDAVRLPDGQLMEHVVFDPTGERIVYTTHAGKVAVRDLASGREVPLGGLAEPALAAEFAADGRHVVVITDRAVGIWDLDRPDRVEHVLKGHTGPVNALDFSRDGRILTTGSDRTIRIWDTDGRQLVVMRGQDDELTTAVFTADGTKVLSASNDGSLLLFHARTGALLARVQPPGGELYDVAVSADGTIATLGKGEVVRVFRCQVCGDLADVRALALSRSPRQLTPAERRQFLASAR